MYELRCYLGFICVPTEVIPEAVAFLFHGVCSFFPPYKIYSYDESVFTFETDDQVWEAWGGVPPLIVEDTSLCNRRSLYLPDGRGLAVDPDDTSAR